MRSALYEGTVAHRRHATDATDHVAHSFVTPVTLVYLDLAETDELFARHPLWSTSRRRPVRWRRRDYLGDPATTLDESVRAVVAARLGRRPQGPVVLLGQVRTWGWLFNPLCVYYCFDADGSVDAVVLEVTSTPWHERVVYVVDGRVEASRFPKAMHVSPFLGVDHDYQLDWSTPGETLRLHLANTVAGEVVFDATLHLRRREATRREMTRFVWRRPLKSYAVTAGIYREALRLWRRGASFHPRRHALTQLADRAREREGSRV